MVSLLKEKYLDSPMEIRWEKLTAIRLAYLPKVKRLANQMGYRKDLHLDFPTACLQTETQTDYH